MLHDKEADQEDGERNEETPFTACNLAQHMSAASTQIIAINSIYTQNGRESSQGQPSVFCYTEDFQIILGEKFRVIGAIVCPFFVIP